MRVVHAVLGTVDITGEPAFNRILPVDVDAVEVVVPDELDATLREDRSRFRGQGHIAESTGERPTSDRDHGLQVRMLRLVDVVDLVDEPAIGLIPGVTRKRLVDGRELIKQRDSTINPDV